MKEALVMFFSELWKWIADNTTLFIFIIGLILEPTKLKPIGRFFSWVGKFVNKEMYTKIGNLESEIANLKTDISDVKKDIDLNEADRIRWEVLNFAEEIRREQLHSKESFDHVISLCDKYRALIERQNAANSVFEEAECLIKETYHKCQKNNSFV